MTRRSSTSSRAALDAPGARFSGGYRDMLAGGCLCGDIRYYVSGPVSSETNCHCSSCRRASGAPFVSWFTVPASGLVFTSGEAVEFASSQRGRRRFCPRCGTPLTFRTTETPDEVDVTLASLDDPALLTPRDHTWAEEALPWVELGDLPAYPRRRSEHVPRLARVELEAMSEGDLAPFMEVLGVVRAEQRAAIERSEAAAAEQSARAEIALLLPQGVATPGHYLRRVRTVPRHTLVGDVWYVVSPGAEVAHVLWLGIAPGERRQGYARAALAAVEAEARALGAKRLELDVFASNQAARAFCRSAGFSSSEVCFGKRL